MTGGNSFIFRISLSTPLHALPDYTKKEWRQPNIFSLQSHSLCRVGFKILESVISCSSVAKILAWLPVIKEFGLSD